ncbi:serine/threonine protein kinase [Catenulispora subtropica]|uniref:non-specific serine/threonine protein kinase n=1 Tax=Catenulispora subtropica TaxID=450798 RepID=A0ABP5CU17_9ACTN
MAGPTPGQVLNGRYELRRRIGGGSMGEVWRGRDLVLGRTVAVKVVLPALLDTPTFRARFVAEARVMAMMDHPGIVGVFDYGYAETDDPDTPGAAFLVMEFIEGESLDKVLARTGPLEPRFALKVLASLLDALAAVHRAGVVHRDVKPANVMLTSGGVVLADFGIARSAESLGLTAADALMGTVPYLAPELFQAETPTPAADVYAVGILGYELLSGRQPFQAASTAAVMYQHMHEPPPPLPDYVAAPAAEVLWRALEKDSALRWTDGADMAAAMRRVLEGPVEVGEEYAAGLDYGRGHAGNASGYEDTLPESGLRRRARRGVGGAAAAAGGYEPAGAFEGRDPLNPLDPLTDSGGRHGRPAYGEGFATPVGGFEGGFGDGLYGDGTADPGGRHGRSPFENSFGDPLDRTDPLGDSGGRHGRAAAFGEDAASDIGGRPGRPDLDETATLPESGGRRGRPSPDATARPADLPDATRVFEAEPGGRHASPTSEIPLRRRAAEPGAFAGVAAPSSGRGASPASRTDAARRRTLVTAAVAAPALLGLTVALVVNASGSSPSSGGTGTGPGAAHQADLPTSYDTSSDAGKAYPPSSSSSAGYGHSSPRGHGTGTSASGSFSQSVTGTRTSAATAPYSSLTGPSTVASSTAAGSTPTLTQPSSPTSTPSSASTVGVPDVTGKTESQARTTLTGQGFQVVVGTKDGTGTGCTVASQSPGPSASAPYGSTVTINLSCS